MPQFDRIKTQIRLGDFANRTHKAEHRPTSEGHEASLPDFCLTPRFVSEFGISTRRVRVEQYIGYAQSFGGHSFAAVNFIRVSDRIWMSVNPMRIAPITQAAAVA